MDDVGEARARAPARSGDTNVAIVPLNRTLMNPTFFLQIKRMTQVILTRDTIQLIPEPVWARNNGRRKNYLEQSDIRRFAAFVYFLSVLLVLIDFSSFIESKHLHPTWIVLSSLFLPSSTVKSRRKADLILAAIFSEFKFFRQ